MIRFEKRTMAGGYRLRIIDGYEHRLADMSSKHHSGGMGLRYFSSSLNVLVHSASYAFPRTSLISFSHCPESFLA
jgi:hypothetical protein